jgi:hypothetical protein
MTRVITIWKIGCLALTQEKQKSVGEHKVDGRALMVDYTGVSYSSIVA